MLHFERFAFAAIAFVALARAAAADTTASRRLIEFGWTSPIPHSCAAHQKNGADAFDGVVFDLDHRTSSGTELKFMSAAWGHRTFSMDDFEQPLADLKATSFTRLRHNFIRLNVTPGDIGWFEDFTPVLTNVRIAATVAHATPCDGVLLDIETYARRIFEYNSQPTTATISWDQYAAQVRRRGREVMQAFQKAIQD